MKKTIKKSSLTIAVEGINKRNEYSIKVLSQSLPEMNKLIGQKVLLSDGKQSAKFTLKNGNTDKQEDWQHESYQHFFEVGEYSIWLKVKVCLNGGSYEDRTNYCTYFEQSYYIGEVKNQILTKVETLEDKIRDYKLAEVINEEYVSILVAKYKDEQAQADRTKNMIPSEIKALNYIK